MRIETASAAVRPNQPVTKQFSVGTGYILSEFLGFPLILSLLEFYSLVARQNAENLDLSALIFTRFPPSGVGVFPVEYWIKEPYNLF
jgi:hypothetical protein